MIKFSKLLLLGLVVIGATTVNQSDVTASKITRTYTAPVAFRKTWYHYEGNGTYSKLKFTKHYQIFTEKIEGKVYHTKSTFVMSTNGNGWYNVHGRKQTAGAGNTYKFGHTTVNGKRKIILFNYYGSKSSGIGHYYLNKINHR